MRRTLLFVWAFLFLLSPISAFGLSEMVSTEITVWAMGAEGKLIRQMADLFESQNPGIKVRTQAIPWSGAHEKLVTGVVGKMTPDVCQLGTTWMSEFHSMNALEPLDEYMNSSKRIQPADFFPGSLQSSRFDGKMVGIPWYVDTRVFYYRSDIAQKAGFDEFPKTWDELLVFVRGITAAKKSAGEKGFGISLPLSDWQIFLSFFWQNGGQLLASGSSGGILSEQAAVETIKYLKMYFDERLSPLEVGKDMDLLNAFEIGFFPVFISGPWMISELERNKPGLNGKWATARMPSQKTFTSFIGGCNLVVFKESRNKQLAWRFIEFLSTAESQKKWYEISKNLPACRSSWDYPALTENQHLKAFKAQLEDTCAPPNIPEWEQIAGVFAGALEEIMYGKKTPEAGVLDIKLEIEKILLQERVQQSEFFKTTLVILFLVLPFVLGWAYFKFAPKERDRMSNKAFNYAAIWFLLPALTILMVFMIIPIYGAFVSSLTNWSIYGISDPGKVVFVGLDNYIKLMSDPIFWIAIKNTLIFAVFGVPLSISLSLAMALLLNQQFIRFKAFFRVGFFIPVITTMVAVALIWRWLYNPEFGLLNLVLQYLGIPGQNWLTDPILALPSLIFMSVWKGFGYNMIIFIAALQGVPDSLYEAADIDGADQTQQFWHITLPMLRNTTFFVGMMTTIGYLQFFAEPYIMTNGGPLNATMSVVLYMYQHGFKYYNLGYASAIAYALFGLIFVCTLIQGRIRKSMECGSR